MIYLDIPNLRIDLFIDWIFDVRKLDKSSDFKLIQDENIPSIFVIDDVLKFENFISSILTHPKNILLVLITKDESKCVKSTLIIASEFFSLKTILKLKY